MSRREMGKPQPPQQAERWPQPAHKLRTLVIKIGSGSLAGNPALITDLATDVAGLRARGHRVVLVSSGAIAFGMKKLGLRARPKEMAKLQAAAATGQGELIRSWEDAFDQVDLTVAQVLLTHADFADRTRANNARAALSALLDYGAVPILNENDSVSVEEIKFGDNDSLAAMVTPLCGAELLVLLSDVDGVRTLEGERIPSVTDTLEVMQHLQQKKSALGSGGMQSKIEAARQATLAGAHVVIADAKTPQIVSRLIDGEDLGTLFVPPNRRLSAKKHWIAFTLRPKGALVLDPGAAEAVTARNRSLLPQGVVGVRGIFASGDAVSLISSQDGVELGRARVKVGALEALTLIGPNRSKDAPKDEIAHRDDMVLW